MTITTNMSTKVAAVATGLAMAVSILGAAPLAHADAMSDLQAQIAALQAQLSAMSGGSVSCSFSRSLTIGSSGADVTCLQKALIGGGFSIPAGATGYFGTQTRAAVASWQSSKNIAPAVGYFGPISRAAFNLGGGSTTPGVPGVPVTGNGLKVMLATDSPNGVALVQGQAIATLAKFTFSNPTSSSIKVTNLAFKRIGVSNDTTLTNVYLYEGTKRLTDSAGVSNSAFNFNDSSGLFTVNAGGTVTVSVLADIAGSTSGQQVGAQLTSVASSGTLDSSVSLPITGGLQTVSAATLGTVDFSTTSLPATNTSLTPQNDYTVWQNTVTIGTHSVWLKSFQLKNIGSIDSDALVNLRLYADGVAVGTAQSMASDGTITWDLSASPKKLETGGRVIKVVGDVVRGSGDTFSLSLRRGSDAMMVDSDLNQPILATANSSTFSARTSGVQTIASGTVSVTKANNSPSSNISLGGSNIKFASFELRASGEDVKIDNLDVFAQTTADHGLDNGKVFLNGVQVGSTKDLTDATAVNFTFGSSMILKAGTTAIVDIYADAKTTTGAAFANGDTATVTLDTDANNSQGQGQVSLTSIDVPGSDVSGNTLTISSSTATLSKYSGYGNQTLISGASNARLGSFTLSTGATEGINVNTLTVTLSANEWATITDLRLVDNATGVQIGTTKATPSTTNSFSVNFDMAASATKTIDVYANVKSGAEAGPWHASVDGSGTGLTTGSSVTFGSTTDNLQTITLATSVITGVVGVAPDNALAIAGSSMVKVGVFDFTAQYSPQTIDKIKVKILAQAATSVRSVSLKYPDAAGTTQTVSAALALSSGIEPHATATFENLTFYVPQNTTRSLEVYVSLATIENGAQASTTVTVLLDRDEGFRATDSSGTTDTTTSSAELASTGTTGKGSVVIRKTIATLSSVALPTTLLADGSNKVIARFAVAASPEVTVDGSLTGGSVSWDKIAFTVNKTAAITLGATSTMQLFSGSNAIGGNFATITGTIASQTQAFPAVAGGGTTDLNLVFLPTAEQTVPAGTSVTYEIRTTVGGVTPSDSLDVAIVAGATSNSVDTAAVIGVTAAATPIFTWSDRSSISAVHSTTSADWMNEYLVKTLPLTVGNLTSPS